MTRQFKTIADAVPMNGRVIIEDDIGSRLWEIKAVFTAAETAKIAKMYLAAYLKEKKALFRPDSEHKPAEANLRAIRKKLAEWEKL